MSANLSQLLEKMNNRDPDIRFMATLDLSVDLEKESFKVDPSMEQRLITQLLKMLEDSANNVQENAVKCLGLFVKKGIRDTQLNEMLNVMCNHMLADKKDDYREIASSGLKAVIANVTLEPPTFANIVIRQITPRLTNGIRTAPKPEIISFSLDIMNDLLTRVGWMMVDAHEQIQQTVLPQLQSNRPVNRKRAIACLARLAVSVPDALFSQLVDYLITSIESASKADLIRTLVQAIGATCRSVGYRLGRYLPRIVPLIMGYCDNPRFENDDELRENCFLAFESLILRSPKDLTPFLGQIQDLALKYVKYDPNFVEDEEDEDQEMETEQGEEEEADEGGNISDDDDMSWKVRRSADKCLSAIVTSRPDLLPEVYTKAAPVLIARFSKEREEKVKLEIFATFVDVLRQTDYVVKRAGALARVVENLRGQIPAIVSGLCKQLKDKSIKVRVGAFGPLRELAGVLPGSLTEHIQLIVPAVVHALADKAATSNLKIEGLLFLRLLLATHAAEAFHPHIAALTPVVFRAMTDSYYRISAEALRVCYELVRVMRPENGNFNFQPFINDMYNACLTQLKAMDIDQEVKEGAILSMGAIIANFGDVLQAELPACLTLLLDRLRNEITRLTTVKALSQIASSRLRIDLGPILVETINQLASFLRKTNRQLKQSALTTLNDIVKHYGSSPAAHNLYPLVLAEVATLVSDQDLHLAHLSLHLCVTILQVHGAAAATMQERLLPQAFALLKSSLLQGLALESLLALFGQLVAVQAPGFGFEQLLDQLLQQARTLDGPLAKKQITLAAIAQTIAAIASRSTAAQRDATVTRFAGELQRNDDANKLLALLTIGEIGKKTDISQHAGLQQTILAAFDSGAEEIKQAASSALGNAAVGAMSSYVTFILNEVKAQPRHQYLLLHSLREAIVQQAAKSEAGAHNLQPFLPQILALLFDNCEAREEGTRNAVAECLGKLALIFPNELLPQLQERVTSNSVNARATIVSAIKFTILEHSQPIDKFLQPAIPKFLDCLKDDDLKVRHSALLTLNYAAHNKPSLIRDVLPTYLPILYAETRVRDDLIREVDVGPFKHKVDDGLEIRKAAFECLYTLLDTSIDRLDVAAFITCLARGLQDNAYEIKTLCHLTIVRLAAAAGALLLDGLPALVDPLRAEVTAKLQEGAAAPQVARKEELTNSALRAIAAVVRIPNVESVAKFDEFFKSTIKQGPLAERFQAIIAEEAAVHKDSMDTSS